MSSNGNGYSKFSIAGLCISLLAPFLFGAGGLVYLGIILPFVSIILSVIGIIDARKNDKNGALLSTLGIIISVVLILFVIATGNMLATAQRG